jgi:hypothetical protein
MAGRRRSRTAGHGMMSLFDVDAFARAAESADAARRADESKKQVARAGIVAVATPVNYWVRGVFRCGDGQFTRTVQAVGMNTRLDADVAKFVRYLREEGFQFAEGRGYLIELLGVGTDEGVQISFRSDAQ